jgi:large subunit ribosomal protein L6
VNVAGPDRQKVGHFAALVREKRPVEPYNLKGIKYEEEVVKKKAGKTFVSGA